jgi:hypothetical protein
MMASWQGKIDVTEAGGDASSLGGFDTDSQMHLEELTEKMKVLVLLVVLIVDISLTVCQMSDEPEEDGKHSCIWILYMLKMADLGRWQAEDEEKVRLLSEKKAIEEQKSLLEENVRHQTREFKRSKQVLLLPDNFVV